MHNRHYTRRIQALVRQSHLLAQLAVGPVELAMQECQLPRDGALLLPEASDGRQSRLQFLLLGSDSTGMTCAEPSLSVSRTCMAAGDSWVPNPTEYGKTEYGIVVTTSTHQLQRVPLADIIMNCTSECCIILF